MMMQIEDEYYKKAVALPNNFDTTLPPVNSDLAKSVFKDPYNFGFVDMTKVKQEKDLEDQFTLIILKHFIHRSPDPKPKLINTCLL